MPIRRPLVLVSGTPSELPVGDDVPTPEAALDRANHTGVQAISTITNLQSTLNAKAPIEHVGDASVSAHPLAVAGGDPGFMSGFDKNKLNNIAAGATSNSPDATLLARANHTGTQPWSTITDTPTTRAGYGITDAAALTETTALAWQLAVLSSLTAGTPLFMNSGLIPGLHIAGI